jgi:hypothetical protein
MRLMRCCLLTPKKVASCHTAKDSPGAANLPRNRNYWRAARSFFSIPNHCGDRKGTVFIRAVLTWAVAASCFLCSREHETAFITRLLSAMACSRSLAWMEEKSFLFSLPPTYRVPSVGCFTGGTGWVILRGKSEVVRLIKICGGSGALFCVSSLRAARSCLKSFPSSEISTGTSGSVFIGWNRCRSRRTRAGKRGKPRPPVLSPYPTGPRLSRCF